MVGDTQPKSNGGGVPRPAGGNNEASGVGGRGAGAPGTAINVNLPPVMDSETGPKVILGTTIKPDLSAMRNALKPEVMTKVENTK